MAIAQPHYEAIMLLGGSVCFPFCVLILWSWHCLPSEHNEMETSDCPVEEKPEEKKPEEYQFSPWEHMPRPQLSPTGYPKPSRECFTCKHGGLLRGMALSPIMQQNECRNTCKTVPSCRSKVMAGVLFFLRRGSLNSPGHLGTYVDQADLKPTDIHLPLPPECWVKGMWHHTWPWPISKGEQEGPLC